VSSIELPRSALSHRCPISFGVAILRSKKLCEIAQKASSCDAGRGAAGLWTAKALKSAHGPGREYIKGRKTSALTWEARSPRAENNPFTILSVRDSSNQKVFES